MANVKFFRLGLNNGVSQATYEEYKSNNASVGGIIFAQVKQEETEELAQYIWANGIEYHVADASELISVEQKLTILLDGAPADTSIGKMIDDAITEHGLSAEKFVELISADSNVTAEVVDGSVRLTAPGSHASIDVSTVAPEEYFIGETPKHGDYYVKLEYVSFLNSDTHKTTTSDDPSEIPNLLIEPRRTAYIYNADSSVWQALDGNVDATNVFFKDGVDRTAGIGVLQPTTGGKVETEGKGQNLKDLLEYYLVEELTKGTAHDAVFNTPAWSIVGGNSATPKDLSTYIKINNTSMTGDASLVKVGSTISISKIEVKATPAYSGATTSFSGTPAYIDNMFKYSEDGITIINSNSSTGTTPSADFINSSNFSTASATMTLSVSTTLSAIISSDTSTGNVNSSIALNAQEGAIPTGVHTMTLSYLNNLSAWREIDSSVIATTVSVYPVSNKDSISKDLSTANGLIPSDRNKNATNNVTKGNTSVTITAVYPIFINGTIKTEAELIEGGQGVCGWYDNSYAASPVNELTIFNYNTNNKEYIVTFGPNNNGETNYPMVFIPEESTGGASITIERDWSKDNAWKSTYSRVDWLYDGSTNLSFNGIQKKYVIYTCKAEGVGASAFKLNISKKS